MGNEEMIRLPASKDAGSSVRAPILTRGGFTLSFWEDMRLRGMAFKIGA